MKHIWTILCKKSVTDNETNMISLFDAFEQLDVDVRTNKENLNKTVNLPVEYEIVSFWVREKNDDIKKFFIKTELLDPNLQLMNTVNQEVDFPENLKRIRTRLKATGLPLTVSGYYMFRVEYKIEGEKEYKNLVDIPLEINLRKDLIPTTEIVS